MRCVFILYTYCIQWPWELRTLHLEKTYAHTNHTNSETCWKYYCSSLLQMTTSGSATRSSKHFAALNVKSIEQGGVSVGFITFWCALETSHLSSALLAVHVPVVSVCCTCFVHLTRVFSDCTCASPACTYFLNLRRALQASSRNSHPWSCFD